VGKSTLLNHVLRQKITITSRKPQTTRHNLLGVDTEAARQAIYVDTPGIHDDTGRKINQYMVRSATSVLADVDLVVMLIDRGVWTEQDDLVVSHVRRSGKRAFAVINKADLVQDKSRLLPVMAQLDELDLFEEVIPLSALKNEGVELFRELVFASLPENPHLFPDDQITDQNERFLVSEIIREKLMRRLGDELPHRATVMIERFDASDDVIDINAEIFVERQGQKRIVIGKEGAKLKSIGTEARKDIEQLLDARVMLNLWVKVRSNWTDDAAAMRRFGYD
jgi:GTP-binding protein Era|tara:strand:+ start:62 stop:901 length:840 start_codon:yes stop_codon:yes gene_type:complete